MKRKLIKCSPRTYSELIKSDIPRPFGSKPSRPFEPSGEKSSRPSEPSDAKSSRPSALGPPQSSIMKPSREEIQARVEFFVRKKRSVKRKVPTALESSHVAQGKVSKLGASSSPSSIREQGSSGEFWVRGRLPHLVAKVSKVIGPQLRSPRAAVAKSPPWRTTEPPLDILPYLFGTSRRKAPSLLLGRLRTRGGSISNLRGMRTRCS